MVERIFLACIAAPVFAALLVAKPIHGAGIVLMFLTCIGGIRRWLIPVLGYVNNDPLLLIVPIVAFGVFGYLVANGRIATNTIGGKAGAVLLAVMALQVVNPLQGGLAVGISGALFYIVPILWFFLGRAQSNGKTLHGMQLVAKNLAVIAGLYGLWQTFFGFSQGEEDWIRLAGYEALNVGVIRAFSFLTSASEYATLLAIGIVIAWSGVLKRQIGDLVVFPILALALFLESSRSSVVMALVGCIVMWGVTGRSRTAVIVRLTFAVAVAGIGTYWALSRVSQIEFDPRVHSLIEHQIEGLSAPFGEKSTAGGHVSRYFDGIILGLKHPWGFGLGSTTIAASKFGNAGLGTEGDISNMFVSLGPIGGVAYSVLIIAGIGVALELWRRTRSSVALAMLGVLTVQPLDWLNGGHYATAMFTFFSIGAADRVTHMLRTLQEQAIRTREEGGVLAETSGGQSCG